GLERPLSPGLSPPSRALLQRGSCERFKHLCRRWRLQDVACRKILRISCGSHALCGSRQVVAGMPQFNLTIGSEQEPVGAGLPERHSHAASIHYSSPSDHSIELHVRMTADDERNIEAFKDR